mgnify:CR=1 FL=1
MQFDNDLVDIFNTIAKGQRTEAWTLQTIVRLVMNLQEVRRTLQVAGKLAPEQIGPDSGGIGNSTYYGEPMMDILKKQLLLKPQFDADSYMLKQPPTSTKKPGE